MSTRPVRPLNERLLGTRSVTDPKAGYECSHSF